MLVMLDCGNIFTFDDHEFLYTSLWWTTELHTLELMSFIICLQFPRARCIVWVYKDKLFCDVNHWIMNHLFDGGLTTLSYN